MSPKFLESLGIEEKDALIYIAGLALGMTTVQELARKSGVKRPTVYLRLDELTKQGLFERLSAGKKTYYRATDPERIEERLKKNLMLFQAEIPKLSALRSDTMGKPLVRVLEGEEGLKEVYGEIRDANSFRAWSNMGEVYGPFHNTYMELAEMVREQGINVREITADTKEARRYMRLINKVAGPTHSLRLATSEGIENDTIIYGDVVALFRLSGLNMFVIRIQDKTMANTMRAIFDMAWKGAKPFK